MNDFLPAVRLFSNRDNQNTIEGFLGLSDDKIEMLFVHPSAFGKGLGKKLLEYAVKVHGIVHLDVNEQNPTAVGFYQHMGFVVTGLSEKDGLGKPFPILHMKYGITV